MSKKYIPLYTKYRPMIFADITGQENTVKALSNAIKTGKIMHAYLFCGPRGTGKTSSARIFAKSLNCINGPTVTPCGKCPGCLDVINSTPVDVIEIDAASNRSVEDARNILEKVQYAPLHGKYKIYIIDEVHMLTTEASNTLLKTLEEPPENVIFILATTESHKVLDTIISRCQRYDFRRITTSDIVKRLDFIAKSENIKIEKEALIAIAKNSAGGMRDAVALLDQLSVLGQESSITINDVNDILGQISYDIIYDIANCIKDNNVEQALLILNEIHDKGNEPGRVITTIIQYFRDMLILKSCSDKNIIFSMTKINEIIFDKIKQQSNNFDNQTLIFLIEKLEEYFIKIKDNTNKFMWAELCLIDLTSLPKIMSIAELSEKIQKLEEQIFSGITSQQNISKSVTYEKILPKKIETVVEIPSINIKQEEENILQNKKAVKIKEDKINFGTEQNQTTNDTIAIWRQITAEIKPPAQFFFSNIAKPIEINSHKIIIGFSNEGAAKQANDLSKKTQLQSAACKYFDVSSIQIEVKIGNFSNVNHTKDTLSEKKTVKIEKNIEKSSNDEEKKDSIDIQNNIEEQFSNINNDDIYSENFDNLKTNEQNITSELSDTARNIMELFDGKITNVDF
ncbi:DNA polymerase III subunit gamma/tau [bacterium]|nr:DNA polymerase III subunit gamma/tau [bacterium]